MTNRDPAGTFSCVGLTLVLLMSACADDTARDCLPEEEPRDPSEYVNPQTAPFCDTTRDGIHNSRPEYAFGPNPITVCREMQDDESCDGCDFADWEADLLAKGEAFLAESSAAGCECDSQRVDHMEPACFLQVETADNLCCYRALIWSNTCEYVVIGDEPDDSQCDAG